VLAKETFYHFAFVVGAHKLIRQIVSAIIQPHTCMLGPTGLWGIPTDLYLVRRRKVDYFSNEALAAVGLLDLIAMWQDNGSAQQDALSGHRRETNLEKQKEQQ
jgi:hypothetical protein